MKNWLTNSPHRQTIKMIVIGFVVLVTTFIATLTGNWLTSRKSVPDEIIPPLIAFNFEADILTAESDEQIDNWAYVGPKQASGCQEIDFRDSLGLGRKLPTGHQLRLNYERDFDKYYCFKAENSRAAGYRSYHVTNLSPPTITLKPADGHLIALANFSSDDYQSWQYIILNDETTPCSSLVFSKRSQEVVSQNLTPGQNQNLSLPRLSNNSNNTYYCFRTIATDGISPSNYQTKLVNDLNLAQSPPQIKLRGNLAQRVQLFADQDITRWAAVSIDQNEDCDLSKFDQSTLTAETSTQQPTLITPTGINLNYCIRASNQSGIYAYTKYQAESENQIELNPTIRDQQIDFHFSHPNAEQWQTTVNDSDDGPISDNPVSHSYPAQETVTYLTTTVINDQTAEIFYQLPEQTRQIVLYRDIDRLKALNLTPARLTNWSWIKKQISEQRQHSCDLTDFEGAEEEQGSELRLEPDSIYCFKAEDEAGNNHFSPWFEHDEHNLKAATEIHLSIAHQLKLTALGSFAFYQTPIVKDTDPKIFALHCSNSRRQSCYDQTQKVIRKLQISSEDRLNRREMKESVVEAIRHNYLSGEQKAAQDFRLKLAHDRLKLSLDKILYAEDGWLYEAELYNRLYRQLMTNANHRDDYWSNYHDLFFQS